MRKFIGAAFLSACLLLAGCGGDGAGSNEPQKGQQKICIGLMPDTDSVPFLVAREKGFFREEGVEVELQPYKSAMDRDSALQSGVLDGAVSDLLAAAFAKEGGFDVQATSFTDGSYRLVAGSEEPATDVRGLGGKEVAVSKNTIIEYVTDRILEREGMEESSIRKVIIPQIPARLEMLQNGKLAGATLPEPMASIAVAHGCRYISGSDELGINPGIILFRKEAIEGKGDSIRAMYRAYDKAVRYLNGTDPAEYMDLVLEKGGFPPSAKGVLELPKYREAGLPERKDVTDCMVWMAGKGLVKESYSYETMVSGLLGQK